MTLHHDLLEQAEHLAKRETKKPKQASLRRAVSSAYYALFHLLVSDGARRLAPAKPDGLDVLIQRALAMATCVTCVEISLKVTRRP